jgi:hypothetical protein
MFRFVNSDPALVEAHARTQQAMHELELGIREAFERYDQLADRLEGFDRRLQAARVKCHAEPLSNDGYHTRPEPARAAGTDQSPGSTTRGAYGSNKRTLSKLPAPA